MKNIISEEEKNRILNLHQEAIKKNRLSEQIINGRKPQDFAGEDGELDIGEYRDFLSGREPKTSIKPQTKTSAIDPEVKKIQQLLTDLGYGQTVGRIDGIFGTNTKKAINLVLGQLAQRQSDSNNITQLTPKSATQITPSSNLASA